MNEQEREIFERRSVELAQVRASLDEARGKYTDVTKALSHVLHDGMAKDAHIAKLEAELVVWKANDAQARRDWNADREAASKVLDVMGELTEFSTPEEAARDLVEQLKAARAELARLEASAPTVPPAVDESGEPSAYDAQAPVRRVFIGADVSIGDHDYGSIVEIVAKSPSPGELVKVGDRVRFAWPGGDVEGVVDQAWSDDTLHVKYADRHYYTVKRSGILEILPTEASLAPSPGEIVKVGDRVQCKVDYGDSTGTVVSINRHDRWPIEVNLGDGRRGSFSRDEVLEILPAEAP